MTERQAEALEKLSKGIQESRRTVQQQTMELAQDYFVHSTEALKDQIKENRATLERLPDQIPGGREEAFQAMFQELMDNYSNIQSCLEEAQQNVSDLDPDQMRPGRDLDRVDGGDAHENLDRRECSGILRRPSPRRHRAQPAR